MAIGFYQPIDQPGEGEVDDGEQGFEFDENDEPTDEDVAGEEIPEGDEPAGEEGEDEEPSSEGDEDWAIQVPVPQNDGTEQELTFGSEELKQVVAKGVYFDRVYKAYEETKQKLEESQALSQYVSKDPFLSGLIQNRATGGNDQEYINRYLGQVGSMNQNTQANEDERQLDPEVERILREKMLGPLEQKIKENEDKLTKQQQDMQARETLMANSVLIDQTIAKYGIAWDDTPEQQAELARVKDELFPGMDIQRDRLTERQVAALFAAAGIPQRKQASKPSTQRVAAAAKKASSAPKIISGQKGQGRPVNRGSQKEFVSKRERAENYKKLFG